MDEYLIAYIGFILIGVFEIIIGLPLIYGKIKPNVFYGFRTPKTINNKEIWYKANKHMGRDFVIAGIFLVLSSFVLYTMAADLSIDVIVLIETILLVVPIILIIIRGFMHLKEKSED